VIYSIEILRFFSSIFVIIYHYEYFFFRTLNFKDNSKIHDALPFDNFINWIYVYGDYGVQIFWCISGFVISYIYLDKINSISFKKFAGNRISRLYPLHLITLIVALVIHIIYEYSVNFPLSQFNDSYHFILHLFFISSWGLEQGPSYNLPIWSVSKEIIAYILFFFLASNINNLSFKKIIFALFPLILLNKLPIFASDQHVNLLSCLILFLSGLLIYKLYLIKKNLFFIIGLLLLVVSFVGNFKIFIFSPGILILFISLEKFLGKNVKKIFSLLGNLTYSSYLFHYPLTALIIIYFKDRIEIFSNNYFFIGYLFFVLFLSHLSFKYFEIKAKYFFRKIFEK